MNEEIQTALELLKTAVFKNVVSSDERNRWLVGLRYAAGATVTEDAYELYDGISDLAPIYTLAFVDAAEVSMQVARRFEIPADKAEWARDNYAYVASRVAGEFDFDHSTVAAAIVAKFKEIAALEGVELKEKVAQLKAA
ncbi:hypothetical protein [Hoeflea olei]|uniref:Uncharacterized protein n=1 Tax=Hoeflea olei TaxID=1480615 RepID=A0A1C1YSH2_9HYPH|nr:hypothetical protein [Hoeflea olei]OCW56307.1 hypothetical protein AWJ14_19625 [Hoeflea olei]